MTADRNSLQYAPPTTGNPSAFRVKGCPRCAAWSDPELKKVLLRD